MPASRPGCRGRFRRASRRGRRSRTGRSAPDPRFVRPRRVVAHRAASVAWPAALAARRVDERPPTRRPPGRQRTLAADGSPARLVLPRQSRFVPRATAECTCPTLARGCRSRRSVTRSRWCPAGSGAERSAQWSLTSSASGSVPARAVSLPRAKSDSRIALHARTSTPHHHAARSHRCRLPRHRRCQHHRPPSLFSGWPRKIHLFGLYFLREYGISLVWSTSTGCPATNG